MSLVGRPRTKSDADLLSAARAAFIERGASASTRDIARRAGVSEAVLFQRFGTKAELLLAAMAPPAHHVATSGATGRAGRDGRRRLSRLVRELVEYFREATPVLIPLMSQPGFDFEAFARRHPEASLSALRRDLVERLAAERAAGRLGPVAPGAAALLVISLAQTVALFERLGAHGGRMPDAIIEAAAGCLWEGFGPRKAAGQPLARRPRGARTRRSP